MKRGLTRSMAMFLLENALSLPRGAWTVQGFGFARLRVSPSVRLHIWHSSLRVPGVSDIHDHAQWSFSSRIIAGQLVNLRFEESSGEPRYNRGIIKCGVGGGMSAEMPTPVDLVPQGRPELYEPGMQYFQRAEEIHRTYAADGTVTLIQQQRTETDTARVYWPIGTGWVDAIPRQATQDEIICVTAAALPLI